MECLFLGSLAKRFILSLFIIMARPVFASEHGGGGAAGPEPMPFVVNVGNSVETMRVLQVTIVLEFATPEASRRLAEIKPKVQHHIILLLSSEEIASLQTIKGKRELQERMVNDLNGLIDETVETGVKEVFFTSFIIQ